ncbi:glycoside hydrolase family 3 protein [Bdellovibrio svalbardensis]|uniref:Glycoside hydrolase family 3 protein n=1 Tax=Bdellovibrio svalbardensis TaxID=2972972 RepID=A0ABT6DEN9_9BACT|nr:glycoside hydrolase family 3 protein [Bdellovibrio svalbardensis]MDG0814952.1 glycoside hydrolase family 3 protein [Bdellovibrio svalbardensis]
MSFTILICIFPALVLAQGKSLDQIIDAKISAMTVDEKVGQLFIVGFPNTAMDKDLHKFIATHKPGAFLLFKRNVHSVQQITALNASLYQAAYKSSKLPPLIAIDQEGGAVSRLPIDPAPPNALAIGQTQSPLLAEEMGYQTGLFLREVGFNMNLAPVLDVANPFSTSFIGVRSFGADPELVKELGVAYSKGLMRSRVIPTAKHFPGTGDLKADPHTTIVKNVASISSLKAKDLIPFQGYSSLGNNIAVMLSHSIYPALDSSREPASFSSKISTNLLRDDLKYKGLVVTDDLQMKGSKQLLRPEMAALKAIKAGADIVMLTWSFADQEKAIRTVRKAVVDKEISAKELNAKLHRILMVKAFANIYKKDPALPSFISSGSLSSKQYADLEDQVLSQNIKSNLIARSLPGKAKKLRAPASLKKVCALSPTKDFLNSFVSATTAKVLTYRIANDSDATEIMQWSEGRCPVVILAVTGKKTAKLLRALPNDLKKKTIVVNLGSPGLIPKEGPYRKLIQLYFNHKDSGKKVAEHLNEILGLTSPPVAKN